LVYENYIQKTPKKMAIHNQTVGSATLRGRRSGEAPTGPVYVGEADEVALREAEGVVRDDVADAEPPVAPT